MENTDLQRETNLLLADEVVNGFDSKRYTNWAIKLLEKGHENESLYILAGLDGEDRFSIKRYFDTAVEELEIIPEKNNERLIDIFAVQTATDVLEGVITPDDGLANMVKIARVDFSDKYSEFVYLSDNIYDIHCGEYPYYFPDMTTENIEEVIIREFRFFYEAEKQGLYGRLDNMVYCKKCFSLNKPVLKRRIFSRNEYWACSVCGSEDIAYNTSTLCREKMIEFLKKEE